MVLAAEARLWVQFGCIALVALAAWRVGGGPERALAATLLAMVLSDQVYHLAFEGLRFVPAAPAMHLAIDVSALLAALAVALLANRIYPLWFAAFQLIAVLAHVANDVAPGVASLAYRILYVGPSYFQIMLLAGGIWLHRRRVRRHGPYRPWRTSSSLSPAIRHRSWPSG
ncbi:hypothetical protein N0B51_09370 [Tsuneonella sp. YG55]|uniref:Uncharacterized protein n=1 Tax=Tsuneonella litorea TaxID=2976475 RepID=A0A9X2W1V0_9SPHN|nr:hypothetical protein [Tsuneonella litorea]MCT2559192.1 hypothetical protein [Tsuneonella litorea]